MFAYHPVNGKVEYLLCYFVRPDYALVFVQNPDSIRDGINGFLPFLSNTDRHFPVSAGRMFGIPFFHVHRTFLPANERRA
jgi:hypothetical protein